MEHLDRAQACGIDFGTSNSTVGWLNPSGSILVPLEGQETTLPSVVFFNYEDDTIRFGRRALADYLEDNEGRLMRSLKSLLGSNLIDGQTEVQGKVLPFRHLLTVFIGEIKRRAQAHGGACFSKKAATPVNCSSPPISCKKACLLADKCASNEVSALSSINLRAARTACGPC